MDSFSESSRFLIINGIGVKMKEIVIRRPVVKDKVACTYLTYLLTGCREIRGREQLLERCKQRCSNTHTKSRRRCVVAMACKVENWCTYMMVSFVVKDVGDSQGLRVGCGSRGVPATME